MRNELIPADEFIALCREYGQHLPNEMRVKTIDGKQYLADDFADGFGWLWDDLRAKDELEKLSTPTLNMRKRQAAERVESVYLMKANNAPHYKIGRSTNVKQRLAGISGAAPGGVSLVVSIVTNDSGKLESELHEKYGACRLNGEWFALTDKDVREIKSISQM